MTWRSERESGGGPRRITSLQNEQVKLVRSLNMRKARRETGLFVAEGAAVLLTARDEGWRPRTLIFEGSDKATPALPKLVRWAQQAGADCLDVSEAVMGKLAAKDNPQTVMAVFEQRWADLPDTGTVPAEGVWLALEAVRDPGNLGTIVRTVDAVGAQGIVLIGAGCDPYAQEAVRASMGSVFSVKLVRADEARFLAWRANWTGDVVGTHLRADADFRRAPHRFPVMLMMGSEGAGLSETLTQACTQLVKIPMAGRLDSLNLAIATALTLYQIRGPFLRL